MANANTNTDQLLAPVRALFEEVTHGAAPKAGWILNGGDHGLLAALDRLDARRASAAPANGGATIAAHVNHVTYALELLNRWQRGEDPFESADWVRRWSRSTVDDGEWAALRAALRRQVDDWRAALNAPRDTSDFALTGIVASVAHLAYHMGAMRQIDRTLAGPSAQASA